MTDKTLATWHASPRIARGRHVRQTRMVYAVNRSAAAVLDKLSVQRIGELWL